MSKIPTGRYPGGGGKMIIGVRGVFARLATIAITTLLVFFLPRPASAQEKAKITSCPIIAGDQQFSGTLPKGVTGITVTINGKPVASVSTTITPGKFTVKLTTPLQQGKKVEVCYTDSGSQVCSDSALVGPPAPGRFNGHQLRTVVGFEQSGASSTDSTQDFFFDLHVSEPIDMGWHRRFHLNEASSRMKPAKNRPPHLNETPYRYDLGPRLRTWLDLRIASAPQQITSSAAQFVTSFAQSVGQVKVSQVAQSFEFLGGFAYRILESKDLFFGPSNRQSHREAISIILGGGAITPLSPDQTAQVFQVPTNQPAFLKSYPAAEGKKYVSFPLEKRDSFFREGYAGFRFETYIFDLAGRPSRLIAPADFDATYGFDEAVTSGVIHGGVVRLEGFVPIPTHLKPFNSVYIFGTGIFRPVKARTLPTYILQSAPASVLPTDPDAVVIPTAGSNHDYYRVGVGIDLIKLLTSWNAKNGSAAAPAQ